MPESLARAIGAIRVGEKGEITVPAHYRKLHKLAKLLEAPDTNALYRRLISQWHEPHDIVTRGTEREDAVSDTTIPQEANLDELGAVSYTKGCYTGQELVARVHFRGHVNRHLRGVRASGTAPPVAKATLFDATSKAVGDVRSTVSSPRLGGIALAMIRREIEAGTQLIARWSADPAGDVAAGETQVDVVALPFVMQ